LQVHPDESIAVDAGVRLIVPDRPGMGLSDFQEKRQIMDWPEDIKQLADQLQIERFGMLGITAGGGPWALHCAYKMPERLSSVAVVSSHMTPELVHAPPSISAILGMARMTPSLLFQYLKVMAISVEKEPEIYLKRRLDDHAEVDRKFLQSATGKKLFIEPLIESMRNGPRGLAWDITIGMQNWEIGLEEITYPVHLWYGTEDLVVPIEEAETIASLLPNCMTRFVEGEGQYLFISRWRELLDEAVQAYHN
jgi:pimeloyl-ACP methyl ester carboxylesterase